MCLIVFSYETNQNDNNELTLYLHQTLPPIILNAGVPLIKQSRANNLSHCGQIQGLSVKSWLMRSLKHFSRAPFPPFRYLNSKKLQPLQYTSTVLLGPFLLGFAINYFFSMCRSAKFLAMSSAAVLGEISSSILTMLPSLEM